MNSADNDLFAYRVANAYYGLPKAKRDWKTVIEILRIDCKSEKACINRLRQVLVEHEDKKKLVKHIVMQEGERYLPREAELEEKVRKSFGLRAAIVVNISSLNRPSVNPNDESKLWPDYEDRIHQHLGVYGGWLTSALLRPGDVLGTGGGRGLYYTAQNCFPSMASQQCGNVVSLTGQIGSDPDLSRIDVNPHFVDADYVASHLHSGFQPMGLPIQVGRAITAHRKRSRTVSKVTVALTGIGALGGRHRFKQFEHLERLKPVAPLLRSIFNIAKEMEANRPQGSPFYHAVGDLCNWLFVIDPQPHPKRTVAAKELERLLKELNARFLNTTPEELSKIAARGSVIAVAGGPLKSGAIGYVLNRGRGIPWITHLVTDHEVAQEILDQQGKSG